ncbi:MAG: tetratricopeptide repeat protein [Parabacteroides sp.]|jgi:tetratricopeptide (TPR) repeat protein|nr:MULTISPECIES: tetratricopeptide repeat protein [Bacteroidales]MDD3254908.1 tetratricopeptide repeat protein [Parabacteroides sp.]MDT3368166.1 tetratricopeptide repeat protein [Bacteroidota bacterium]MDD3508058.1 tetratricopeptide repeat protein [Parabacteroides sp.]MDD4432647.1 tetratricopeptide repeat protein [Parabacteroides sp.]HML71920.1 tetratricopeptide repeat protein [Macellibacteroides fermentans]
MGASFTFAQKAERKNVREGNKLYKKEKYTESEISYRKSLEVNPRSIEGTYNLGNSLYKQGKFPEAAEQYQLIAAQEKDPVKLAQVFHNLGNISMKNKQYDKSVQAYRQSLRLNPKDDETRYNLALAQKLLENQQNQDQSEEQQNKDQKDDQKNKEDQQQNQQQQQDDKKQNKTQEEQQQNEQMSKDNAQQMLDAFLQDEKDTQEKVKKAQMQQQQRRRTEKEW